METPLLPFLSSSQRRSVRVQAATKVTEQGPDMWNTTYYPKAIDTANNVKPWYVINAEGQTLGRLASLAASYIRGKHLPTYHPASDMGSYVVILNAEKVEVTGTKFDDKYYFNHTQNKRSGAGRIGGYRIEYFKDLQQRRPEKIIEEAVYGMLPKGRLGEPRT